MSLSCFKSFLHIPSPLKVILSILGPSKQIQFGRILILICFPTFSLQHRRKVQFTTSNATYTYTGPDIKLVGNYFLFLDIVEVYHDARFITCKFRSKVFIVRPFSAIRPSSVTGNLRGRYHTILSYERLL